MANEKELAETVEVACMTSDFAMQVRIILKQKWRFFRHFGVKNDIF